MKPELLVKSGDDKVLRSIVSCISGIECSEYFSNHLGIPQSDQRQIVAAFQATALPVLAGAMANVKWTMEHRPSPEVNDAIDIFGKGDGYGVVIELDKTRADQVAKKFVSRMALLKSMKVYFVTLCYQGTKRMNKPECEKYFRYCSALARRMDSHYAGFIIGLTGRGGR